MEGNNDNLSLNDGHTPVQVDPNAVEDDDNDQYVDSVGGPANWTQARTPVNQQDQKLSLPYSHMSFPKLNYTQIFGDVPMLDFQVPQSIVDFIIAVDNVIGLQLFDEPTILKSLVTKVGVLSRTTWILVLSQSNGWFQIRQTLLNQMSIFARQLLVDKLVNRNQLSSESFYAFSQSIVRYAGVLTQYLDYPSVANLIVSHVNSETFDVIKCLAHPTNPEEMNVLTAKVGDILSRQAYFTKLEAKPTFSGNRSVAGVSHQTANFRSAPSRPYTRGVSGQSTQISCSYCKTQGHHINDCFKLKRRNRNEPSPAQGHGLNVISSPDSSSGSSFNELRDAQQGNWNPEVREFNPSSKN